MTIYFRWFFKQFYLGLCLAMKRDFLEDLFEVFRRIFSYLEHSRIKKITTILQ
jgi:hypothetical protein